MTLFLAAILCTAEAVYWESRGEPAAGQIAVAQVIQHRIEDPRYPDTACEVVHQPAAFSYFWDGKSETFRDKQAYGEAVILSTLVTLGWLPDVTNGATHFHTTGVKPSWSVGDPVVIGGHLFLAGIR